MEIVKYCDQSTLQRQDCKIFHVINSVPQVIRLFWAEYQVVASLLMSYFMLRVTCDVYWETLWYVFILRTFFIHYKLYSYTTYVSL